MTENRSCKRDISQCHQPYTIRSNDFHGNLATHHCCRPACWKLASTLIMSSKEASSTSKAHGLERKWLIPTLLGVFICSTIYFLEGENAEIVPQDVIFKNVTTSGLVPTSSTSAVLKPDPTKKVRGNSPKVKVKGKSKARPVDLETMLESFEAKRQELYKQLELDYGPETFKKLLLDHGRTAIGAPSNSEKKESMERMRRKMMLKILEGQAATTKQRSRNLQSGDGENITSIESRRMQDVDLTGAPTYVWATGGHRYVVSSEYNWRTRRNRRNQPRCPPISLLHTPYTIHILTTALYLP